MLEIKNLHASVEGKEILRGVNLTIRDGEVHVLMGPNGSGKSTLSNVLVGNPKYEVTEGSITFNGKDLLALPPEDRAHEGVFMSFQAPTEIPGVSMTNFMRAALNAKRKYFGQEPIPAGEFLKLLKDKRKLVGLDAHFMSRGVNEGFSGGERKRNEIFQMAVLEPTFSILDETDSGLDVDALRIVAEGFNMLRTPQTSAMVITHYQRMLDYLKQSGLLDSTLVVYTSDQGFYMGEHGWFDKRFMYEESLNTPLVMRLPKGLNARGDINEMVQNIDYAPTFLQLAGAPVPADIQGVSLLPLLQGKHPKNWRKSIYYHYYEYPAEHAVKRHYGVRSSDGYKLIHFYNDINKWELYNLNTDPHEMHNIYGQPGTEKITARLMKELVRLQKQYDDQDALKFNAK